MKDGDSFSVSSTSTSTLIINNPHSHKKEATYRLDNDIPVSISTNTHDPLKELFEDAKKLSWKQSQRYLVPVLSFFSVMIMYLVRYPLTHAMIPIKQEYGYDQIDEGWIKGAFFIGYLPSQIMGGYLARKFGGKYIVMHGLLISCMACLLIPISVGIFPLFIILRIIIGIGQGVIYPSMMDLLGQWLLPGERTFFINFSWSGGQIGTIFEFSIYPILMNSYNWRFGFYLFSSFGVIWAIAWFLLVYNHPKDHPWLSQQEFDVLITYESITRDRRLLDRSTKIPYRKILSSYPVYTLAIMAFCFNWPFYFFMDGIAKYCNAILGNISIPPFVSTSLPYLVFWISILLSGYISDVLIRSGFKLSIVRRSLVLAGFIPCAILLYCAPVYPNARTAYVSLVFAVGLAGISQCGYSPNSIELSPEFASTIISFVNMLYSTTGIIVPIITGKILKDGNCKDSYPESVECKQSWNTLLMIAASIYVFGAFIWTFFSRFHKLDLTDNTNDPEGLE